MRRPTPPRRRCARRLHRRSRRRGAEPLERIGRQHDLEQALGQGQPPTLTTEDVTRGLRVEVWDDTAKRVGLAALPPHDVEVVGFGQGRSTTCPRRASSRARRPHETPEASTNSPIHVHEAVFGWEGWSLSAPRPGQARAPRGRRRDRRGLPDDRPRTPSIRSWSSTTSPGNAAAAALRPLVRDARLGGRPGRQSARTS